LEELDSDSDSSDSSDELPAYISLHILLSLPNSDFHIHVPKELGTEPGSHNDISDIRNGFNGGVTSHIIVPSG
jgi:hypothetical protein